MKRLITLLNGSGRRGLMTVLMLCAVSMCWADGYIWWGAQNSSSWSRADLSWDQDGVGTVSINLTEGTTYEFCFCDTGIGGNGSGTWYHFSNNPRNFTETTTNVQMGSESSYAGNGSIKPSVTGAYIFKVEWKEGTPYFSLTYPKPISTSPTDYKLHSAATTPAWSDIAFDSEGKATVELKANTVYPFVIQDNNGITYSNIGTMSYTNCTDLEFTPNTATGGIATTTAGTYIFSIDVRDGKPFLSVTYPVTDYYIVSNGVKIKGVFSESEIHFTLPARCYTNGALSFNIYKTTENGTTYFTASSTTFTAHSQTDAAGSTINNVTDDGTEAVAFTYTSSPDASADDPDGEISVIYHISEKSLVLDYESRQDVMNHAYYLIVPNENVGKTNRAVPDWEGIAPAGHKAFRFFKGRERNSTEFNEDLVTLNLKIDETKGQQLRYDSNGKIRFYIQDGNNTKTFRPANSNEAVTKSINATNGIDSYCTVDNTMQSNEGNNNYYEISHTDAGDTKSLTFMFSEKNAAHRYEYDPGKFGNLPKGNTVNSVAPGKNDNEHGGNSGNLIVGFLQSRGAGSIYYNSHIKDYGVYLVGSIAKKTYTHDKSYPMTKRYWKGGSEVDLSELDNDEAKADSIVYDCLVRNSDRSWDDFFLSFSTGDKVEGDDCWNLLLRPHVQDQMDANALEGGIFFFNEGSGENMQQSFNPLLTEAQKQRYVSYTVYFNATYSTYRVEFHDGFYIAGPAVNGVANNNVNSGQYFGKSYRKQMSTHTVNGVECYTYTGTFTQGSTFAFFVNEATSINNYSEDIDYKAVNANKDASGNNNDMWHTQAPIDGSGDATGKDYPFYNHVQWNVNGTGTGDDSSLGENNNGILWTLPTGEYTLRFYNHVEESGNNQLYTIDKVVTMYNATSTFADEEGGTPIAHNYGGWHPFSDDCALWLPNGVKAYYVSEIREGKAVLKEVKDNTIPAHCGVILRNENLLDGTEDIHLYPVPTDYTTASSEDNLLVDCYNYDDTYIQPVENGKYNYFLTPRYYRGGVLNEVPMNFWKTITNAIAAKNGSYLSVDQEVLPVAFNSASKNYSIETNPAAVAANARSYCFPLAIEGFDAPVITSITSVGSDNGAETSDAWYTLQGVKIGKPAMPGIYIQNGKKVIIR